MRISDWSSDVCSSDLRIGDDIISRGLAGRQRRMTDRLVDIALYIPQVIGTGGDEVEHAADPDFPRTGRQTVAVTRTRHIPRPRSHRPSMRTRPGTGWCGGDRQGDAEGKNGADRKSTRLNSSH